MFKKQGNSETCLEHEEQSARLELMSSSQVGKRMLQLSIGPRFGFERPIVAISRTADGISWKYPYTGQPLLRDFKGTVSRSTVAPLIQDKELMQSKMSSPC